MSKEITVEDLKKRFDISGDGKITDEDIMKSKEIVELQLSEQKAETQKKMAWVSVWSMVIFTALLFSPIIPEGRVSALSDLLGLFFIAQAGVVGAYMGVSAWMSRR
jgi:hypothetical protein